jgi:hypothetical protein
METAIADAPVRRDIAWNLWFMDVPFFLLWTADPGSAIRACEGQTTFCRRARTVAMRETVTAMMTAAP